MLQLIDWLEAHNVTVDILKWFVILATAWATGLFGLLRRLSQRPKLELYGPSGFCYLEERIDEKTKQLGTLAVFIVNPSVKNPSDRAFEIDRFYLGYDCRRIFRRFRQKLFHVSFPSRPQKKFGEGIKVLPVFFTRFPDNLNETSTVQGEVEARTKQAAYAMFISNTWGSWTPRVQHGMIKIKLTATTVGEGTLTRTAKLRIFRESSVLRDFCPDLHTHVRASELWNLEQQG